MEMVFLVFLEALMLAICVGFCSCFCIVCSNVSEALMLPYVSAISVLACAKFAHVFSEAFLLALLTLSLPFLTSNSSSDSKAFLRFIAFCVRLPYRSTPCFFFFNAKAWPQSQTDLFMWAMVLHCGHTFLKLS